ncbi:hypothetical protein [Fontivita pretiosa]|uniref:hypothetical protein n=1 Tax=Fontivita pretiosa TaxID=2989684 RepID=UPI003D1730D7
MHKPARAPWLVGPVLAWTALIALHGAAIAQTSFFSATGTFTQGNSSADFHVSFDDPTARNTWFQTWAWNGTLPPHGPGTNAAGDVIASGGIDSELEVFTAGGTSLGYNDDRGPGERDSHLGPDAGPLSYLPPLGPGQYRARLTAAFGVIWSGAWAMDMTREGTFRLDDIVQSASWLGSLKFGSSSAGGAVVRIASSTTILGALEAREGGKIDVQGPLLRAGSLLLGNSAQLDLRNARLIIDYRDDPTAPNPIDTIAQYVAAGYNGGAWNGPGIYSSVAATAGGTMAIGFGDNATLGYETFAGQQVDPTSVLAMVTHRGDANLDGRVDVLDLTALAAHWQQSGIWAEGDFDYSGRIDIRDLYLLASRWGTGLSGPLSSESFLREASALGLPAASVPEPDVAAIGLAVLTYRAARNRRR